MFQVEHIDIKIVPINMNDEVKFMIDRVDKPQPELGLDSDRSD